jgi:hypothetical protein
MTTPPRSKPGDDPFDPSDPESADQLRELSGEPRAGETRAAISLDEIAPIGEDDSGLTGTERERGYLEAGVDPTGGLGTAEIVSVEDLREREDASDETFDADIATEEGVPWVPPVDPVVVPDERDPEGLAIAGGIGSSVLDEPFDAEHHSEPLGFEDEMTTRVREALRDDAETTAYADLLTIDTDDDVVTLTGTVADIDDLDAVLAVAATVEGITEVVDELEIEAV